MAGELTKREGVIFILSAPSGAGKTTLINGLMSVFPELILSVSCTTRARRPGETAGRDYYFLKKEEFGGMKNRGEFAEWARVHGFLYGTPRRLLDRSVRRGRDVILDIDVQGARKIKRVYPRAVSVFLLPPSWRELAIRLALRGTDRRAAIRRRLENARREIKEIMKYDYYLVNREVKASVELLTAIVAAERQRVARVRKWRLRPLGSRGAAVRKKR